MLRKSFMPLVFFGAFVGFATGLPPVAFEVSSGLTVGLGVSAPSDAAVVETTAAAAGVVTVVAGAPVVT